MKKVNCSLSIQFIFDAGDDFDNFNDVRLFLFDELRNPLECYMDNIGVKNSDVRMILSNVNDEDK